MKKLLSFALIAVMLLSLFAGCGSSKVEEKAATPSAAVEEKKEAPKEEKKEEKKDVTLKVFQLKVEIADALKKLEADYEKETGVKLKFETVGGGADYNAALLAKFASGDEPDIFNSTGYADMEKLLDKLEDLSGEPWVKDMVAGTGDSMTKDGKLYGQPQALEGFGFAYNKALFKKAGINDIPKTLTQLEDACKKLQAAGIQPFVNSYAEWWVLGVHNITLLLSQQPDHQKFIAGIADGSIKVKDNKVSEGWVKLLDLTVKYGQKNMTTKGDYNTSVNDFAAGKGAMIQQGNWIQGNIDKIDPNLEVGFLPMPTSEEPEEKIYAGVPQSWCVNKNSKNKDEAKKFLTWLVQSETGKNYITKEFMFIPAFKNIEAKNLAPLNASLNEYAKDGKVYMWAFAMLPPGSTNEIGAALMKYVGGQMNKDKLFEAIEKAIKDKAEKK